MSPKDTCEVCGLDNFLLEDGFYFCSECGTKLLTQREVVNDFDEEIVDQPKGAQMLKNDCSSWEQMNYILHGLTERLIELGAQIELKQTVLQIWCSYLRHIEVAFFSKRHRSRPHLSLYNKKSDLKLLFNRVVSKSLLKPKNNNNTFDTSTTRGKRKLTQRLLEEQNDVLQLSQSSDIESTLSSSMHTSTADNARIAFRFNRHARKRLKKELHIDEEHIQWHEQEAPIDAPCHSISTLHAQNRPHSLHNDVCRKSVIIAIIALALNQISSPIQLTDVLRWIDEGHLPAYDLEELLPEESDPACYSETLVNLTHNNIGELRNVPTRLTRSLGILPVPFDLTVLCERYLGEMALPSDLHQYILKLIAIGPQIKQGGARTHYPAFEQHAMTYILFVMKLLFGLDGVIETKMDALSGKVNNRLSETIDGTHPKLFIWHDWQQYVTMRRTILEQVHYPTSQQRAMYMNGSNVVDSELFLDFSSSTFIPDGDNTTGYRAALIQPNHGVAKERRFKNIHSIIATITDKQCKQSIKYLTKNICFAHSLQPQRTYMAELLDMHQNNQLKVYIPDYMWTDHSKRTIVPFVSPHSLKQYLQRNHEVRVKTKTINQPVSHIRMENVRQPSPSSSMYFGWREFTRVTLVDDSESSESDNMCYETNILDYIDAYVDKKLPSQQELLHKVICRNTLEVMQSIFDGSSKGSEELSADIDKDTSRVENSTHVNEKLPQKGICAETVVIAQSSFHYWVRMLPENMSSRTFNAFAYFNDFPTSFQFLLNEAAYVTRCSTFELYCKLNKLERHFLKHKRKLI